MAKYKKRADGRYATRITLDTANGKEVKTVYGKTIKELEYKLAELRTQADKLSNTDLTFGEFSQMWLETYKQGKVSRNTFAGYENCVKVHLVPVIGSIKMRDVRKSHLQNVLNLLIKNGKIATAKKVKVTVCQIIQTAQEENLIAKDISRGLALPKSAPQEKRILTDGEITKIKVAELTDKQRLFVNTLLYTGIRRGEALSLTMNDVDFKSKQISITKTLVFGKNQSEIKDSPKSAAGVRKIPIPDILVDELQSYKNEILFPAASGEYMTRTGFRRFWEKLQKDVGLPKEITPHIFRHTYATRLFFAGVDVKTAQYLLGHASIEVTLGIYTHLEESGKDKARSVVNSLY